MFKLLFTKKYHIFLIVVAVPMYLFLSMFPQIVEYVKIPSGTTYSFTFGHTGDYYQLLYLVSEGIKGNILYKIPYTSETTQPIMIHSLYTTIGYLTAPFTNNPIIGVYLLRIVSLVSMVICFVLVTKNLVQSKVLQLSAIIIVIFFTGFYNSDYSISVPWADQFHVFRKFLVPPHHLFPSVFLLSIFLVLQQIQNSVLKRLIISLFCFAAVLVHPYLATLVIGCVCGGIIISGFYRTISWREVLQILVFVLLPSLAMYGYYYVASAFTFPWVQSNIIEMKLQVASLGDVFRYLSLVGIVGVFSVLSLINFLKREVNTVFVMLVLWLSIPFVFFIFNLPHLQIFKTNQYIPFSILAVYGIDVLIRKKRWFVSLIPIFVVSSVFYGFIPLRDAMNKQLEIDQSGIFQMYVPQYATKMFADLNRYTEPDSVVLARHIVSYMIPVYTHNRVIVGQADSRSDFDEVLQEVEAFYSGYQSSEQRKDFLQKHNISYVVFNFDSHGYTYPFNQDNFLKPIVVNEPITIAKVLF